MKQPLLRIAGAACSLGALLVFGAVAGVSVTVNADPAKPLPVMGYAELRQAGWVTPRPPYPAEARIRHESGTVFLYLKTDAAGKIVDAHVADRPESTKSEVLRKGAVSYARFNWHGPPNSEAVVKVSFSIS